MASFMNQSLNEYYQSLHKYTSTFFLFFLVNRLKARPMVRWSSKRTAKPLYCLNTLPETALSKRVITPALQVLTQFDRKLKDCIRLHKNKLLYGPIRLYGPKWSGISWTILTNHISCFGINKVKTLLSVIKLISYFALNQ